MSYGPADGPLPADGGEPADRVPERPPGRWRSLRTAAKTLRFRLMVWNAGVVVLTAVVTLLGLRHGVRLAILHEMDQILVEDLYEIEYKLVDAATTAAQVRRAADGEQIGTLPGAQATPRIGTARRLLDDLNRKARGHVHHGWFVQLKDESGAVLWSSENAPADLPALGDVPDFRPVTLPGVLVVQNRKTTDGFSPLIVLVGASTDFLHRDMARIDRLVGMAALVVLLVAPPVGYWLAGRATRPLSDIIRTTSRLRPTQMDERLPLRRTGDELDQLAGTINGLLDRIAAYLQRRREFLANAAHELRTPVAAIRSSVEVALGARRTKEQYEELLDSVIEECGWLEMLVSQLLLLAETESDRLRTHGERANFSEVARRSVEMFQAVAESQDIDLCAELAPSVFVEGNVHHLRQLINNLLDNAIKFTAAGGRVRVTLRPAAAAAGAAEPDRAVLTVSDTGRGIPPEHLPHVFDRFFRGDRSHTRGSETRGTGLGLSICRAVAAAHGGTIEVQSVLGRGANFTVTLPLATADIPRQSASE